MENYNDGFEKMGSRGSWASRKLHDNLIRRELVEMKKNYLSAKTPDERSKIENGLISLSQSVTNGHKKIFEELKDSYDQDLISEKSMKIGDRHKLNKLFSQDDVDIQIHPETKEMEWLVPGFTEGDSPLKQGVPGGEKEVVTLRDIQDIAKTNIKPEKIRLELEQEAKLLETAGEEGDPWEHGKVMANNVRKVTKDNLRTLFYEDFMGTNTTVAKDFEQHPDKLIWDADNDGALTRNDMDIIIEKMLETDNFEMAQQYLAEYMTLKQKQSYDRGASKNKKGVDEEQEFSDLDIG